MKKEDLRIDIIGIIDPQTGYERPFGIKLTHTPTGLSAESTQFQAQLLNYNLAFKRLEEKIEIAQQPTITNK